MSIAPEPPNMSGASRQLVQHESMDRAAWKRTIKDLPISILGAALGYGVGRTAVELMGKSQHPSLKYAPMAAGLVSAALPVVQGRLRGALKERRDAARAAK